MSPTVQHEPNPPSTDEPPRQPQAYRAVRLSLTPEGPAFLADRIATRYRDELPTRRLRPVRVEA